MRRLLPRLLFTAGLMTAIFMLVSRSPQGMRLFLSSRAGDGTAGKPYFDIPLKSKVDSLVVIKHLRELYVYRQDSLLKIYRIALGDAPVGHKHFEGDEKTPEGRYYITDRNAASSCHKNLGISYPNAADRTYARRHGLPPGGDIKIHGLPNGQGYIGKGHLLDDWTNGCVAVTDEEIDELFTYVRIGSPILILP